MQKLVFLIFIGVFLGGCAVGNTHRYDLGDASFDLASKNSVAVSVVDLRPYILSGNKTPNFVGLMRGGFGNPFDIATDSDRALADDITSSIVQSMKKDGVPATGVTVPPGSDKTTARGLLLAANAQRFALLAIREWKTDSYLNTELIFDMSLEILRKDGVTIGGKALKGREVLGPVLVPADARVHAEKAIRNKLEAAFTDPSVEAALE